MCIRDRIELEPQNLKNSKIPSLDEFMRYAKSLESYESELDLNISEKYENWKNNGWKNTFNRPISNWKSTLKSTLPYLKNTSTVSYTHLDVYKRQILSFKSPYIRHQCFK